MMWPIECSKLWSGPSVSMYGALHFWFNLINITFEYTISIMNICMKCVISEESDNSDSYINYYYYFDIIKIFM